MKHGDPVSIYRPYISLIVHESLILNATPCPFDRYLEKLCELADDHKEIAEICFTY